MDLRDAWVLVTGAASGIGLAVTEACVGRGASVVMLDIERDSLENEALRLGKSGAVVPVVCDVSGAEDWDRAAALVARDAGPIDVLVLNAGVGPVGPRLWELTAADWQWTLGVNLWGVVHGISRFVPGMVDRDRGHVVLVSSAAGLLCPTSLGPYVATKHAVTAIGESLLHELAAAGSAVGVTVVWPGVVSTRMADNERNRPERWANPPELRTERSRDFARAEEAMRSAVAQGRDPAQVADQILDAVESRRFGVIEADWIAEAFSVRSEAILAGVHPPAPD